MSAPTLEGANFARPSKASRPIQPEVGHQDHQGGTSRQDQRWPQNNRKKNREMSIFTKNNKLFALFQGLNIYKCTLNTE